MAIARTPRMMGAFQGAMPSTTPTGCRYDIASVPGLSDGITSPPICVVIDAASRSMFDASITLNPAQGAVAPISVIMRFTASSTRACSRSAALSSRVRRSVGPSADHAGNAAAAASAAAVASAAEAAAARVATSEVIGFLRA